MEDGFVDMIFWRIVNKKWRVESNYKSKTEERLARTKSFNLIQKASVR